MGRVSSRAVKLRRKALLASVLDGRDPRALLSSSWAKATIAVVTGLIEREIILAEIRRPRNSFAHDPDPAILDNVTVAPLVDSLGSPSAGVEQMLELYREGVTFWALLAAQARGRMERYFHSL